jgi:hypothetical protein
MEVSLCSVAGAYFPFYQSFCIQPPAAGTPFSRLYRFLSVLKAFRRLGEALGRALSAQIRIFPTLCQGCGSPISDAGKAAPGFWPGALRFLRPANICSRFPSSAGISSCRQKRDIWFRQWLCAEPPKKEGMILALFTMIFNMAFKGLSAQESG